MSFTQIVSTTLTDSEFYSFVPSESYQWLAVKVSGSVFAAIYTVTPTFQTSVTNDDCTNLITSQDVLLQGPWETDMKLWIKAFEDSSLLPASIDLEISYSNNMI